MGAVAEGVGFALAATAYKGAAFGQSASVGHYDAYMSAYAQRPAGNDFGFYFGENGNNTSVHNSVFLNLPYENKAWQIFVLQAIIIFLYKAVFDIEKKVITLHPSRKCCQKEISGQH